MLTTGWGAALAGLPGEQRMLEQERVTKPKWICDEPSEAPGNLGRFGSGITNFCFSF
jgi:hypothetical protein